MARFIEVTRAHGRGEKVFINVDNVAFIRGQAGSGQALVAFTGGGLSEEIAESAEALVALAGATSVFLSGEAKTKAETKAKKAPEF